MRVLIMLLLLFQVFSDPTKVKLNYLNDIIVPKLTKGDTPVDVTILLKSL